MPEFEYRYGPLEFREKEGGMGAVAGTVMRYGDVATLPFGQERMLPGAFGDLSTAELYANRMHQRDQPLANTYAGLRIDDNVDRLAGEVDLPNTSYGRDAQEEVKTGRLRGLSIEFRTLEDDYIDGVRVIKQARLYGWGVVDKPAYPQSVAAMRSWEEYRSAHGLEHRQERAAAQSVIISGPAGAGKTQRAQELLGELQAQGLNPIAADFQSLYAALRLLVRQEDGRYPDRQESDAYILGMAEYLRSTIARRALADDMPVVATISERPTGARYRALQTLLGGAAREEVVDPGVDEIVRRLGGPGRTISSQCFDAIHRWYGSDEIEEALSRRQQPRPRMAQRFAAV